LSAVHNISERQGHMPYRVIDVLSRGYGQLDIVGYQHRVRAGSVLASCR